MSTKTFKLQISVQNAKKQVQAKLKLKAWLIAPKEDQQLASGQTDENGNCTLEFQLDPSSVKGMPPTVYFLIYRRNQLIYERKGHPTYKLLKSTTKVTITLDEGTVAPPGKEIFKPAQLQSSSIVDAKWDKEQRSLLDEKLNQALLTEVRRALSGIALSNTELLKGLALDYTKWQDKKINDLLKEAVLPHLKADPEISKLLEEREIDELLDRDQRPVSEVLQLQVPVAKNPIFRAETRKAYNQTITRVVELPSELSDLLSERGISWENVSPFQLQQLEKEEVLDSDERQTLTRAYDLTRLTNGHTSLVSKLHNRLGAIKESAALEASDWLELLTDNEEEIPDGTTPEVYVENVMRAVERTFSTDFFMLRAVQIDTSETEGRIKKIAPLLQSKQDLFGRASINWGRATEAEQKDLEENVSALKGLANTYHYLGVKDIIIGKGTAKQKSKAVASAIEALDTFYQKNPDLDLLRSNFIKKPGSEATKLNWEGIDRDLQPKVQRQMLAFQRVHILAPDYANAAKLLEKGLDSAYHITHRSRQRFMAESGLEETVAEQVYAKAQHQATIAAQQWQTIREIHHNQLLGLRVDNTIPHANKGFSVNAKSSSTNGNGHSNGSNGNGNNGNGSGQGNTPTLFESLRNELQDIDGYADLFGPQNFCQCDHCKSIFSPAAYFVDLMHFIDENITSYSQIGEEAQHYPSNADQNYSLWLPNRRPDLWCIELSCDCTYDMVPYLEIMNGVKEHYIKHINGWGNLLETEPECKKISEYDIYKHFYEGNYVNDQIFFYSPIGEPYHEMLILLEYFDVSLYEISKAIGTVVGLQWFEYLKVGAYELSSNSDPFQYFGNKTAFDSMSVTEFLKHAKISRSELDDLVSTLYIQSKGSITITKEEFDPGIQYLNEKIINIDREVLSHIRYFIRLWKKLPWTIKETDLVFDMLPVSTGSNPMNAFRIRDITNLLRIQEYLPISLEELVSILHLIPNRSIRSIEKKDPLTQEFYLEKVPGYLSRRFNLKKIFGTGATTATIEFDSEAFAHFLAGVGLSRENFFIIHDWLRPNETALNLDINNPATLSFYYRHSKLSKALQLDIKQWKQLLQLFFNNETDQSLAETSSTQILELVEDAQYWLASPFSFEELLWMAKPSQFQFPVENEEIKQVLHQTDQRLFSSEILQAINDSIFTEAVVANLYAEMVSKKIILETEKEGWFQINTKFDWIRLEKAVKAVDPTLWTNHVDFIKEAFGPYHFLKGISNLYFGQQALMAIGDLGKKEAEALLGESVGDFLEVTPNGLFYRTLNTYEFSLLENIINNLPNSTEEEQTIQQRLKESILSIDQILQDHSEKTQYQQTCMAFAGLSPEMMEAIQPFLQNDWLSNFHKRFNTVVSDEIPKKFELLVRELKRLSLFIQKLSLPATSIKFIQDQQNGVFSISSLDTNQLLNLKNLRDILSYHTWINLDRELIEDLIHPFLLRDEPATISVFKQYFDISETITSSVIPMGSRKIKLTDRMKERALLCKKLGFTGDQLKKFNLSHANAKELISLLNASIRSRYEDENKFDAAIEPYQAKILELKRDILCDYILAREQDLQFKDANELYAFFLLDPQMSGCMKISKIVAAHLSLQLYTHRVQMNLEHSQDGKFKAFLNPDVKEQWEWRKNYRVWEANRKVAVYPENFLEPEWRDDQSPEFKQLGEELLQEKITLESVEGAYIQYLKEFEVIGDLIIAGSYSFKEKNSTYYYFFGRTKMAPYQYYYRIYNKSTGDWTPWEKIELTISASYLSALYHKGRLYIFWAEFKSLERYVLNNGDSEYNDTKYEVHINYSYLGINKRWLQPQKAHFATFYWAENADENVKTVEKVYPYIVENKIHLLYGVKLGKSSGIARRFFGRLDLFSNSIKWINRNQYLPNEDIIRVFNWGQEKGKLILFNENEHFGETFFTLASEVDRDFNLALNWEIDSSDSYYQSRRSLTNDFQPLEINELNIVHSKSKEYVLRLDTQQYLIDYQDSIPKRTMLKLTSTFPKKISSMIEDGLEHFLSVKTQANSELASTVEFIFPAELVYLSDTPNHIDFLGPNGLYFRELFFHIPFLIADHLNAEGKYKDADWWYRKIFDPSAPKDQYLTNPVDRNWQYVEFRDQAFPKYSEDLTNGAFIESYENDPFNPHAIARIRISAYQKTTVLKYIDNLLDWGDSLFRKDTFESINEAMMLYVLAQDILGERPKELCKCETAADDKVTYAQVSESLNKGSDFLIWLENFQQSTEPTEVPVGTPEVPESEEPEGEQNEGIQTGNARMAAKYGTEGKQSQKPVRSQNKSANNHAASESHLMALYRDNKLLFCVPMNKRILGLWDTVEDRLFKIRHCMNIDGVRRSLSLFAPAIDPALLVAARASGLSIADAIVSLDAPIPNYRFNYMLDRAKSFVGTIQSFGSGLLSAMEKKDAEELTLLRSVHEQNILKMTREIKKQQIEENKVQILNLEETKKNIQNRVDYYTGLIDTGLTSWEVTQQTAAKKASRHQIASGVLRLLSSVFYLIPQLGSPFALKFGGKELGDSSKSAANHLDILASIQNAVSSLASIEAGNQRREQEWKQQLKLAEQELKAMEQQMVAAQIRLAIAEKDLQVHQNQMEQAKELHDFYKDKFTNLGLYKYMATTLNRLFSQAYNLAFDLAKKAEKCYQFETDDNISFFIQNDNWDAGFAGLLSGERLQLQLQRMEKSFIEKTPRRDEIRQSFSVRMIDPSALISLRENGQCNFTIPEEAFDMSYPGHYKRMIKSVSITIPSVVGPYTNVPSRLSLSGSQIRNIPNLNDGLFSGPNFAHTSISASSANNDGGQFELNFQDARYLPFEGGGAVNSVWSLLLPDTIRPFDYNTISDVIIHISYTALYDSTLRSTVEDKLLTSINGITGDGKLARLVSLRQEHPDIWHELQNGGSSDLEIKPNFFPYFAQGGKLTEIEYLKNVDEDGVTWESITLAPTPGDLNYSLGIEDEYKYVDDVVLLLKFELL